MNRGGNGVLVLDLHQGDSGAGCLLAGLCLLLVLFHTSSGGAQAVAPTAREARLDSAASVKLEPQGEQLRKCVAFLLPCLRQHKHHFSHILLFKSLIKGRVSIPATWWERISAVLSGKWSQDSGAFSTNPVSVRNCA